MERLLKQRATSRGWLTRASRALDEVTKQEQLTVVELKHSVDEFNCRLVNLDSIQSQIEELKDESDLEETIEEAFEYRQRQLQIKVKAEILLQKLKDSMVEVSEPMNVEGNKREPNILNSARLPKLELPKFSGNYLEFNSFFDKFLAIVDKSELPAVTKFTYLQSLLTGEALASIKGLSVTDESYPAAKEMLLQRYGRKERVIFAHIQKLLSLQGDFRKPNGLWQLYDNLQSHVRSLDSLGVSGDTYGVILTPLVLSRIPQDIRMEWAREGEGRESDLNFLLEFLYKEIKRRERSQSFQKQENVNEKKSSPQTQSSVAAFHTNCRNEGQNRACSFCGKLGHKSERCFSLRGLSREDIENKVRAEKLCFVCFGHHFVKNCKVSQLRCRSCKGKHNSLLCPNIDRHDRNDQTTVRETETPSPAPPNNVTYAHIGARRKNTLMQVIQTSLVSPNGGVVEVCVLFDGGSDRSFITQSLARELRLPKSGEEYFAFSGFGGTGSGPRTKRKNYRIDLGGQVVELTEIPTICADMFRAPVSEHILNQFKASFSEDLGVGRPIKVDILIGLDYYWSLVTDEVERVDKLVAQKTIIGWMLSGEYEAPSKSQGGSQLLCVENVPENMIRSFWDLECIGISDDADKKDNDMVVEAFSSSIEFKEGRYTVGLPWKANEKAKLLNNKASAEKRLISLSRRLAANPELKEAYDGNLSEMENSGIIKEVDKETSQPGSGPVFYLPHKPVVREDSKTTKVRPVFDASAKGPNGMSLNDCLEAGPNLLPNIVDVLTRFRRWKIAVIADIKKAFLQIKVKEEDQNVLRFFWEQNGKTREMGFDRVPFGTKSSPFLLHATIKHHLSKYPTSTAVLELKENLYVDDLLSGADSEVEAWQLIADSKKIMEEAGMELTKWSSNSQEVANSIQKEFDSRIDVTDNTKVLGLKWNPKEDCFSFGELPVSENLAITKRSVLSFISRLFDPLGFLSPFTVTAKLLFQELWELGVDWDDKLPDSMRERFTKWLEDLKLLPEWKIPRCFAWSSWTGADKIKLHIFCDASEKAYGCCAYLLLQEKEKVKVSLIMSKARVSPLKRVTLPRLELLAALLGARILRYLQTSLRLPSDVEYRCYSDSMIVLGWIKGNSNRWKTFVANRVQEIQNLSDPSCWHHCAGIENPADLLTRGMAAKTLLSSELWLHGPDWLSTGSDTCSPPDFSFEQDLTELAAEELKTTKCVVATSKSREPPFQIARWSSLGKAIRVVGWCLRFIDKCSKKRNETNQKLTCDEQKNAHRKLIEETQREYFSDEIGSLQSGKSTSKTSSLYKLSPFIGDDGLMRVKSRLDYGTITYDEKFPVLLPKCHFSLLLARDIHLKHKHAGVNQMISTIRNQYWIVGLRTLAKGVKRECFPCKRLDAKACQEPIAPLMEARLKQSPPFSEVGIDYAGPIFCKDFPGHKFYVLLFTCAVIRAVHLELVESLSLSHFLLAFQRFVARRGMPNTIFSDNAMTFKSASMELFKLYGSQSPRWRFSVPRAPWWGGWWERMVKSMKQSLKRSIGLRCLEKSQLETTLIEVEACINSRPLTFVGDDFDNGHPLTPSHFLIGRGNHLQKVNAPQVIDSTLERVKSQKHLTETQIAQFWERWKNEYMKQLPLPKRRDKYGRLEVGSVVLIREDNCPRLQWPLGVIKELIKGRDGIHRAVDVKTKTGSFIRPIQRIHDLELHAHPVIDVFESGQENQLQTKSGRLSKAPSRFEPV